MTKRSTKTTKSPTKPVPATTEDVLDSLLTTIASGAQELSKQIELIKNDEADDNGHDKGSRVAFLTSKVGSLADSVRKIEAARAKRVTELSLAQVIAWLRQQDADTRARVAREMHSMERRGGVLG